MIPVSFDESVNAHSYTPIPLLPINTADLFTPKLLQLLQKAIRTSPCPVRAVVLPNPHNPFGRCYSLELIEDCLALCQQHGIHLVFDEVYGLASFSGVDNISDPFTSALSVNMLAQTWDNSRLHIVWAIRDFGPSQLPVVRENFSEVKRYQVDIPFQQGLHSISAESRPARSCRSHPRPVPPDQLSDLHPCLYPASKQ